PLNQRLRTLAWLLHPPKPDLSPVRVDAPWTVLVVVSCAGHALEDDTVTLEVQHLPRLLIQDAFDPPQHSSPLAAVLQHLRVERHTAVPVLGGEGLEDLLLAL